MSGGPLKQYLKLVSNGTLRKDPHQYKTVNLLETLHLDISKYSPPAESSWWKKFTLPKICRLDCIYMVMWGPGRFVLEVLLTNRP
jgi:predicted ATPase